MRAGNSHLQGQKVFKIPFFVWYVREQTYHVKWRYYRHQAINEVLELKTKQLNPQISWDINGIYKQYNPTSKRCNMCPTEKLERLDDPDKTC